MKKETSIPNNALQSFLLWDMAGTLIPFHPVTGRPIAFPGIGDTLRTLKKDFQMAVTTGDHTISAREFLNEFELLTHFEHVFGNLSMPVGKPHGEILLQYGGSAKHSLSIGDRLQADIAADTSELVTILVNQNRTLVKASRIPEIINLLKEKADTFPDAFRLLADESEPDHISVGSAGGGKITAAWLADKMHGIKLWTFEHQALDSERLIVVI